MLITWAIIDICLRHIRYQHRSRTLHPGTKLALLSLLQSAGDCILVESFLGSWLFFWWNFNPTWEGYRPIMWIHWKKMAKQFWFRTCQGSICLTVPLGHYIHQIAWSIRFDEVTKLLYWLNKTLINMRLLLFRRLVINEKLGNGNYT